MFDRTVALMCLFTTHRSDATINDQTNDQTNDQKPTAGETYKQRRSDITRVLDWLVAPKSVRLKQPIVAPKNP